MDVLVYNSAPFQAKKLAAGAQTVEISLAANEVFTLPGDPRGARLEALHGLVWVTQDNDPQDYMLTPGQKLTLTRRGRVLVEALPEARIRFSPSS